MPVVPIVLLLFNLVACLPRDHCEEERRNVEVSTILLYLESSAETGTLVESLLKEGDVEEAKHALRQGIFLDLQFLDDLTKKSHRALLGRRPDPMSPEGLRSKVIEVQKRLYTRTVRDAGIKTFVETPRVPSPFQRSVEFIRKMEALGIPSEAGTVEGSAD